MRIFISKVIYIYCSYITSKQRVKKENKEEKKCCVIMIYTGLD